MRVRRNSLPLSSDCIIQAPERARAKTALANARCPKGLTTGGSTRVEIYSPAAALSVHMRTDITRSVLL